VDQPVTPTAPIALSERGRTTIADSVVAGIAAIAVREVDGVAGLAGTLSNAMGSVVDRIRGREHDTAGIGVEVGPAKAAIDVSVRLRYPIPVAETADRLRRHVVERVSALTGLKVVEVNVVVVELVSEEDEVAEPEPEPQRVQ
jgi:uncharacterized alkaline shock family protein YloU